MDNKNLKIMLVLPFLMMSSQSFASAETEKRAEELNRKFEEDNRRSHRLDELSLAFGKYKTIRDEVFYGTTGIKNTTEKWLKDYLRWIKIWQLVLKESESLTPATSAEFQTKLKDVVQQQQKDLAKLRYDLNAIEEKSSLAAKTIGELPDMIPDYIPQVSPLIKDFNDQKNALVTTLEKHALGLNETILSKWTVASTTLTNIIDLRLKKIALSDPGLSDKIKEIQAEFQASMVLDPKVEDFVALGRKVEGLMSAQRVFEARDQFALMKDEHAKQVKEINDLKDLKVGGIEPKLANEAIQSLNKQLDETSKRFPKVPAFSYVTKYYQVEGARLARICSDEETRLQVNCELYKQIFVLPAKEVAKLKEQELKKLEKSITQISKGPL